MSDDDEHRRSDGTGEFAPFQEETEIRPIGDPPTGDHTERMPRFAADEDGTRLLPAAEDDATRVAPPAARGDATAVFPAAAGDGTRTERDVRSTDNWADDKDSVWSARAGVRQRRTGYDDPADADWAVSAEEPQGRWWTPIAVGIVALLLLSLLGWGIYLIVQSSRDGAATPEATAPPAAPATTAATTRARSAAPATEPAQTQPSPPTTPRDVTVPALKGLSSEEARGALDRKGLNYRLRFVTSDSPAGTVIDSDPAEGQQVPADTVVSLIIAAESTAPAQPAPSASTGQPDQD